MLEVILGYWVLLLVFNFLDIDGIYINIVKKFMIYFCIDYVIVNKKCMYKGKD